MVLRHMRVLSFSVQEWLEQHQNLQMTENERLGQVAAKRGAAVGSGKKLCEKKGGLRVW